MPNTEPESVKCESCERLRAALIQIRGFAGVMAPTNWKDMKLHIERQCEVLGASQQKRDDP